MIAAKYIIGKYPESGSWRNQTNVPPQLHSPQSPPEKQNSIYAKLNNIPGRDIPYNQYKNLFCFSFAV